MRRAAQVLALGAIGAVVSWFAACGSPGAETDPPDGGAGSSGSTGGSSAGSAGGGSSSCNVTAPTTCPTPAPRYEDVAPIFQSRCVTCHKGEIDGPWSLKDYNHIFDWRDDVRGDLLNCSMPPPDGGVELSSEERLAILTWIRCGLPE